MFTEYVSKMEIHSKNIRMYVWALIWTPRAQNEIINLSRYKWRKNSNLHPESFMRVLRIIAVEFQDTKYYIHDTNSSEGAGCARKTFV